MLWSRWPLVYFFRSNPEEPQKLELYTPSFDASNFNFKLPSIFVIHGYTDHKDRKIIAALRRGESLIFLFIVLSCNGNFLAFVYNVPANVIVVDWGRLAGHIYFNAAQYSLRVGDYLGDFLRFLEGLGYDLSLVHLVGHSLGAQISGIGGRIVNGKVGRITGEDTIRFGLFSWWRKQSCLTYLQKIAFLKSNFLRIET